MEIDLNKIDYVQVGVILPNCLKLLPPEGDKRGQKIAVASQDGQLVVFSVKKNEVQVHFKTLVGPSISSLQLGGAHLTVADKIFIASENRVSAFNKKGKQFLAFDTNMTEPIKCMYVNGSDLLVCGNHVFNHYKDCKDSGNYLCGDTIVDVVGLCPSNTSRLIVALACSGRVLRLLEHCRVRQSLELDSVPTKLHIPNKSHGDRVLCGFADGQVVLFHINLLIDIKREVIVETTELRSGITCMDTYDVTGDGKNELIVGRRDGTIQIFTMLDENDIDIGTTQLYRFNFGESISSVTGGVIRQIGYIEILVSTYSGLVFGLTTQMVGESLSDAKAEAINLEALEPEVKAEDNVEELSRKMAIEKEKYRLSMQLSSPSSPVPSASLQVNDSFLLNKDEAIYELSIEIPMPIEMILLQCDGPLDLLTTKDVTLEEANPLEGIHLMATFKAKLPSNRVEFRVRTVEGQHGTLQAYVNPTNHPNICELRQYTIKPLSLHMRIHRDLDESRPFNKLSLKGSFSQAEMHAWLVNCIPEMPERINPADIAPLIFRHVFASTILFCEFSKGVAEFKSDNLSTISILKEFLTKEATKKRIKLEISQTINEQSLGHVIKILEPQIRFHIKLTEEHKLLMALLELDLQTKEEFDILSQEYQDILNDRKRILDEMEKDPMTINRIYGFLTDLYIDRFKFKGSNVKSKVPTLIKLLEEYNYDILIDFFIGSKSNENSLESFK